MSESVTNTSPNFQFNFRCQECRLFNLTFEPENALSAWTPDAEVSIKGSKTTRDISEQEVIEVQEQTAFVVRLGPTRGVDEVLNELRHTVCGGIVPEEWWVRTQELGKTNVEDKEKEQSHLSLTNRGRFATSHKLPLSPAIGPQILSLMDFNHELLR
ncbi:hypothetical protein GALMADRAFT_214452 [Galerina marginata CBS 339.88]|uniref:Uncharacterized protein n=1 Tax=Galerina marginata (strain CBS 339.88) TaxID=685588 RepID=A0A067SSQ7_GALM3|nr:hypothetical protein GALMADRAFT_214452 [Galerina marginata CBS 339.88]